MNATRFILLVTCVFTSALQAQAAPADALTGTYTGTLVRERRLVLLNSEPERAVKFKQSTRVAGFGYVPIGNARTLIRLILPARDFRDQGVDREILVDFQQDPPTLEILNGQGGLPVGFPTITVNGKTVIVEATVSFTEGSIRSEDNCKLRIVRTRPD